MDTHSEQDKPEASASGKELLVEDMILSATKNWPWLKTAADAYNQRITASLSETQGDWVRGLWDMVVLEALWRFELSDNPEIKIFPVDSILKNMGHRQAIIYPQICERISYERFQEITREFLISKDVSEVIKSTYKKVSLEKGITPPPHMDSGQGFRRKKADTEKTNKHGGYSTPYQGKRRF